MLAIAKDNFKYPEYSYTNWKKDCEYECWEEGDLLRIVDEQREVFNFAENAKNNLNTIFDFKI